MQLSTIQLSKGSTMSLAKNGTNPVFKLGASWEMTRGSFLGFKGPRKNVDLDLCSFGTSNHVIVDECSYRNKNTGYMRSSGDDRAGGVKNGDNEIITLDMSKVPRSIDRIIMIINSYSGEKFDKLDFAKIRVYEGQDNVPVKVHCEYNVANDPSFVGGKTLIIGSIDRIGNGWNFKAIGEMRTYNSINMFKNEFNTQRS